MKTITFVNQRTKEKFFCEDTRQSQWIDGVKFIRVHRPGEQREFLIRQDQLVKVKDEH